MGNQHLATYHYHGLAVGSTRVDVYGCWSSETPDGAFDFYDIYDAESGSCLNEGAPLYSFPSWQQVLNLIQERSEGAMIAARLAGDAELCCAGD